MPRLLRRVLSILSLGLLSSCFPQGNPNVPIPTARIPAHGAVERLVVVLPGRGDDLPSLRKRGLATIIQQAWPGSDVELTGLTMGYYRAGNATQRLHDEVIAPARRQGYRHVWLLGISLGGMGTVLYDRQYRGLGSNGTENRDKGEKSLRIIVSSIDTALIFAWIDGVCEPQPAGSRRPLRGLPLIDVPLPSQ